MAERIDSNTVRVVRGDTLWRIAEKYLGNPYKYTQLASINNIPNPNKIYVGQIIKLSPVSPSVPTASPSQPSIAVRPQTMPNVTAFGMQSDSEGTLFAIWDWNRENTNNYEVEWCYDAGNTSNGQVIWFVGSKTSTNERQATYSIPSNAKQVKFRVKAVSTTYTANNQEVSYWTGDWSGYSVYDCSNNPPKKPSQAPSVKIDGYKLLATLENLDVNATHIQFQVVKNDTSIYTTGTIAISVTKSASFSCTISAGDEYKVCCRSYRDGKYSSWSDYSSKVSSIPAAPGAITVCRANSETSIYLEWSKANAAKTYEIEYATKKEYFDNSDQTSIKSGIETTHFEIVGIESGQEYFFRVRAVNDKGNSSWTSLKSVVIGLPPSAPTTWSSTTTVITGEPLVLYWVHNSKDASSQTYADLEIYFDGVKESHTIKNDRSDNDKDKTSSYEIDTSLYKEGTVISWRVRTAGVTLTYGDWSAQRAINVYAPPTLQLQLVDANDSSFETLTSFPFYASALAGPKTQAPIGYHISVKAKESYETTDAVGNVKMVNVGEEIYSKHFDIRESLLVEFSANNIDLENNISYTITCVVSMNSGLTAEASIDFNVMWDDDKYSPNAEITVDKETLVAYIRPYCEDVKWAYYKVEHVNNEYVSTNTKLDPLAGWPLEETPTVSVYTTDGDQVFYVDDKENERTLFCVKSERYIVPNVQLSVYRREFDGSFTEVGRNIINDRSTFVTDPHPALDFARYRIIATVVETGAVSYSDLAGYPVGEKAVIIQWNEEWSKFETSNEDEMEKPPWAGSMLKLPYNIDVSDDHDKDVSLIKYTGRKRPVSYYGTQLGETSNWKVEIPKDDKETLYTIRRLSNWAGDVYTREPSGTGYWSSVKVSYDINHNELTVPVSFKITRVEGGL